MSRQRRFSLAKRNAFLAMSVFMFMFGFVGSPVGDVSPFDLEPAAADHCSGLSTVPYYLFLDFIMIHAFSDQQAGTYRWSGLAQL